MKPNRLLPLLFLLACVVAIGGPAAAQTSFPMLGSAFPAGVQRGKTTEVTVSAGGGGGTNLYGAYKVMFEGEGVKAEIVPPEKGWPARDTKKPFAVPEVNSVKMRVTVAPDAPLGVREFRLATPVHGISSVGLLVIGDEPEVLEAEPNNEMQKPQGVTLPCVVNGRIQQSEDVDIYKFKVVAGQEVVFAVLCARLEDKIHDLQEHADPMLVLSDANGNELARNDDYYRADPLLHYKFEKAGEYLIQIRDVSYKGNPHWVYRLTMTTRPYIIATVPCAVRPGQGSDLHVTGFNLGDAKTVHLDVPANAPQGVWTAQLKLPNGISNPVSLLVKDAPQAAFESKPATNAGNKAVTAALKTEGEKGRKGEGVAQLPNHPTTRLPQLALPGGVNSWLATDGEVDRYTFHTKSGMAWGFEVTARRLDSEMDSELKIRDAKGSVLASNDDAIGKDSRIEWSAPADGDYTVEVRDLTGHCGATYFYNLTAEPLRPDFSLKCDTDRAMIAPGNRTAWYILLERKHAFAGPVTIEVKGLPPGVSVTPLTIPPQMSQGVFILTAAPNTKIDAAEVQVIGKGQLLGPDGKPAEATRVARPQTEIYLPGGGRGLYPVDTQGVAITEANDLEVAVNTQQITLAPGGTVKIEVTLKRRPDYTKPVTLDLRVNHLGGIFTDPLPPGITIDDGASKTLLGDNETKGYIVLKAAADAKEIKDWPLAVLANASINFVMKVWYSSPLVTLTINKK